MFFPKDKVFFVGLDIRTFRPQSCHRLEYFTSKVPNIFALKPITKKTMIFVIIKFIKVFNFVQNNYTESKHKISIFQIFLNESSSCMVSRNTAIAFAIFFHLLNFNHSSRISHPTFKKSDSLRGLSEKFSITTWRWQYKNFSDFVLVFVSWISRCESVWKWWNIYYHAST